MDSIKKFEDFELNEELNYELLGEFRTKLEELTGDYLDILGRDGVRQGLEDVLSNFVDLSEIIK